jgi:hypothetical protein
MRELLGAGAKARGRVSRRCGKIPQQNVKQHLAAIRLLFDWLVTGHVVEVNPASSVRGPKYVVKRGKTPVLTADQARTLLDSIETDSVLGLRDRALIGLMVFSFARVSATIHMRVEDYYQNGKRWWFRLHEKGGKLHDVPAHHNAEAYMDAYIQALTRDAILPILGVLFSAADSGLNLVDRFDQLPKRFSRAALLENFPRSLGLKIVTFFSAGATAQKLLARFFTQELGFATIAHVDYTDGIRVLFDNGDVAHVRPSGNADELRIYTVADTQARADAIAAIGVAEPNGILRCMQKAVAVDA